MASERLASSSRPAASAAGERDSGGADVLPLSARLRAVAAAAGQVLGAASVDELRSALAAACHAALPFETLTVLSYDAATHTFQGGSGAPPRPIEGTRWGRAVSADGPIVEHDGERAAILAPLRADDAVLGVLAIERSARVPYDEEDLEVAAVAASLAAASLSALRRTAAHRAAERAQHLSETRFRALFDQFPLSVQIFDPEGRTLDVNRAWGSLFRLPPEALADFNPLRDPQLADVRDALLRGFAGETVTIPAHPFDPAELDGAAPRTRWLEVTVCPVHGPGGEVREVFVVHRDVTDRHETEEALREQERQLREAQRIARLGRWRWDIDADAVAWSEELYRIYGLDPEAFGASVAAYLERVHPDDRAAVQAHIARARDTGEPFAFEERIVRPDGEVRVLRSTGEARRGADGRVTHLVGVCLDITEQKAAEAALQRAHDELEQRVAERTAELAQAEARFRAIVEASPTPLLLSRLDDGAVLYANDRLDALIGVAPGSLVGQRTPDFYYDPADRPQVLETVRTQGYVRDLELRIKRADGTPRWVSLSSQRLLFNGAPAVATALVDVTERREAVEALRQRTQEIEAIFRALPDLYFRMAADGTILDYRAGRSFGLYVPPEAFLGRPVQEVLPPPVGPQVAAALAEVARTGDLVHIEYMLPLGAPGDPAGGERRDFEARLLPLEAGQVVAVVRDVTERKRAEEALRASEESYRGLFDHLTELVYIQDLEGRFLNVNEAVVQAYGYTQPELVGKTPDVLGVPGTVDPEAFGEVFARAVAGETQRFEWWGRRKDGSTFPKEVTIQRSTYFGEDVVIAVARDISERKEAEAELLRQRTYFEEILNSVDAGIAVFDADGRYEYVSPKAMPDPELRRWVVGKTLDAYARRRSLPPAISEPRSRNLEAVLSTRQAREFEQPITLPDGSTRMLLRRLLPVLDDAGAVTRVIGYSVDITERVEAERVLRFQKTLLEAEGEASIDGILVVSEDGGILSYNQRFVELWGVAPEVVASGSDAATLDAVLDRLEDPRAFLDRVTYLYDHPDEVARDEVRLRDGRIFDRYSAPVKSREGDAYGRIWFFRDMTAERRHAAELETARREADRAREQASEYALSLERSLEELRAAQTQLVQQEKMAGLGRLTAGIAHEIRNPLNFVNNFAALSGELVDEVEQALATHPGGLDAETAGLLNALRANAAKIEEHGRRAGEIVRGMMDHARAGSDDRLHRRRHVDLNALVEGQLALALEAYRALDPDPSTASGRARGIRVHRDLDGAVGAVSADPEELGRVVRSLLTNALDALDDRASHAGAGPEAQAHVPTVTVRTRREAGSVVVAVSDNGIGVPEDSRDRVFEPFFTTKPAGSGHPGLGLSLAHEVAKGYGGWLEVESTEGAGATFTLTLPTG
ncbi:MAG: PAS domain S-box protein [Rubricoccaceae bacterium]|nr:PAS domain S-box protein [Rubricoccaceae bacterium]